MTWMMINSINTIFQKNFHAFWNCVRNLNRSHQMRFFFRPSFLWETSFFGTQRHLSKICVHNFEHNFWIPRKTIKPQDTLLSDWRLANAQPASEYLWSLKFEGEFPWQPLGDFGRPHAKDVHIARLGTSLPSAPVFPRLCAPNSWIFTWLKVTKKHHFLGNWPEKMKQINELSSFWG